MRKKLVCILFCAIMIFSILTPSDVAQASRDFSVIRVKISVPSSNQVNFYVDGNYSIGGLGRPRGSYAAINDGTMLTVYCDGTPLSSVPASESIRLVQNDPTPGSNNFIWINNSAHSGNLRYLGDLEIRAGSGGTVDLINHIFIEDYLCGVVPHEMSNSWPIEALKAQAVCARTYAFNMMAGVKSSATYDVVDTSSNQVYKGYNDTYTTAIDAVYQTAGQVLKSGSAYVDVYYAASNGGWTDIPQHRWTATNPRMPYHVIQPDPFDTANSWSLQELIEFPKTVDGSNSIHYYDWKDGKMVRGSADKDNAVSYFIRMAALKAVEEKGFVANVTDDLQITGFSKFEAHTHDGQHGVCNDYTGTNPCPVFKYATVEMTVLAARTPESTPESVTVTFEIDMTQLKPSIFYRGLRLLTVEDTGSSFKLWHRRYGYTTGMSQRGAQERARSGHSYADILAFYYPNTELKTEALSKPPTSPIQYGDGVIKGDCNGDGVINISDYTAVRLHILQLKYLPENMIPAADVNNDGQINISDYTNIRLHILKLKFIS